MAVKIFLDANVILDFLLKRPHYHQSRQLFQLIVDHRVSAITSPSIVHILIYWLGKAYGPVQCRSMLSLLFQDVEVAAVDHQLVQEALHGSMRDLEDALQYHTALRHRADYFVSRDADLKRDATTALPVLTPEELLETLDEKS